MSTKRATTRTNARNEGRYLVTVENPAYAYGDTQRIITTCASSIREARRIWKGDRTKRIYKLIGSGRGVK